VLVNADLEAALQELELLLGLRHAV
jgi:hypothetical protein